jgi:hypothetical protein
VGLALADTPYIVFLNQDDLLFPDFLESALAALKRHDADLYTGSALFADSWRFTLRGYALSTISPPDRRISALFAERSQEYFEPISAWMARVPAARRVGRFLPAGGLYRPPIEEWLLRAARAGLTHVNDARVMVLKDNSRPLLHRKRSYEEPRIALGRVYRRIGKIGAEAFRAEAAERVARLPAPWRRRNFVKSLGIGKGPYIEVRSRLGKADYRHYLATGEDRLAELSASLGLEPGWFLRAQVMRRTGLALGAPPDLDAAISHARRILEHA